MFYVIEVSGTYKVMDQTEYKNHCILEGIDINPEKDSLYTTSKRSEASNFAHELNHETQDVDDYMDVFGEYSY